MAPLRQCREECEGRDLASPGKPLRVGGFIFIAAFFAGGTMNRIVHLALKVEDLEKTTEFYEKVFGFREVETRKTRDHLSRHLSDGAIDFTLIKYDADTESAESKASGEKPCIHHFAVEVEDIEKSTAEIKTYGCEIISDPGVIPVKFRAPGGTVAELVPVGRYKKPVFA
jgi:lactoylglutathione lyase